MLSNAQSAELEPQVKAAAGRRVRLRPRICAASPRLFCAALERSQAAGCAK